jgi:hypothetical protein
MTFFVSFLFVECQKNYLAPAGKLCFAFRLMSISNELLKMACDILYGDNLKLPYKFLIKYCLHVRS